MVAAMTDLLAGLPRNHFAAIYADPAWRFETWSEAGKGRSPDRHYQTMPLKEMEAMDVAAVAADDCVLFMWATWPMLPQALQLIASWGFTYKTCAFDWMKADVRQADLFCDEVDVQIGGGYWTRSNTEFCLLATRGAPQRLSKAVRMGIIEPRRQHSRKPDCVYGRIEALVAGPYLELFARTRREGWSAWGNETDKFPAEAA